MRQSGSSQLSEVAVLPLRLATHSELLPVCYPRQQSSNIMSAPSQTAAPPSNFKSMLDAALAEYKKKTGDDLLAHWLAAELQICESVDAVLDVLRDQAKAFERSGDQKLMKWIDPLVHVLHTFSGTLGDGVSLVCIRSPIHDHDSK